MIERKIVSKAQDTKRINSSGPTWPFGTQRYHDLFNQQYNGDMYPNYASPGYSYGYSTYHYPPVEFDSITYRDLPSLTEFHIAICAKYVAYANATRCTCTLHEPTGMLRRTPFNYIDYNSLRE